MDGCSSQCSVCSKSFVPRFHYQICENPGSGFSFYCSQACQQAALSETSVCNHCGSAFHLEHAYQAVSSSAGTQYYCSMPCKDEAAETTNVRRRAPKRQRVQRIAVFNHKGGTGKTTTAVNLAAGLAERGQRVLLLDADSQGNVGASLGIRGERGLYHVLVHGADAEDVAVPVRPDLFVLTSNEALAAAELYLAGKPNRDRILRERLASAVRGFDCVVIDCAPALSLMNQNVLAYADSVIIPVGCDYLSLVGVRQVLRTLSNVERLLNHRVELLGVLPTFFDQRNRIARDTVDVLRRHFHDRCFAPIRVNTRLREAPSVKQTIFEYAADSHGAVDYWELVAQVESAQDAQEEVAEMQVPVFMEAIGS